MVLPSRRARIVEFNLSHALLMLRTFFSFCFLSLFEKPFILAITFLFQVGFWDEPQRRGVYAIAHARGRRAIVKYMPKMGIGMLAAHLGTHHKIALVNSFNDISLFQRLRKTRPPGARFEFVT